MILIFNEKLMIEEMYALQKGMWAGGFMLDFPGFYHGPGWAGLGWAFILC